MCQMLWRWLWSAAVLLPTKLQTHCVGYEKACLKITAISLQIMNTFYLVFSAFMWGNPERLIHPVNSDGECILFTWKSINMQFKATV